MKNNDLTQGSIWKKLFIYFLPIAAGTLFQQLYSTVDAIIVGKFVGTEALAAVGGSPYMISGVLIGFFTSLASGASVIIAQHYGAKDKKRLSKEIHTSMTFCFIVGILLGIIVIAIAPQLLRLLKTPEDTMADALIYTRIYFTGTVLMLVFNMASGILRAMGDSRRPFIYLLVSCAVNIALDLYFVINLKMGVAGAAWATVIAQAVSCVMAVCDMYMHKEYPLRFKKLGIDIHALANMMRIGIPSGIQTSIYNVSGTILQVAVNTLGTVVVASWSMASKLDGVYWAISSAFGAAIMNFIGQNYGAAFYDRIKKAVSISIRLFSVLTVVLCALILIISGPALGIIQDDPAVTETTMKILLYIVPFYPLWTIIEIYSGVLRGVGDAIKPSVIIALGVGLFRVIWVITAFQFAPTLFTICICYPISWGITGISLLIYYYKKSDFAKKLKTNE